MVRRRATARNDFKPKFPLTEADTRAVERIISTSFYSDSLGLLFWLKKRMLGKDHTETLIHKDSSGIPIGCMNFSIKTHFFSGLPYLQGNFLAVAPESRRQGIAKMLISEVVAYAMQSGIAEIKFSADYILEPKYRRILENIG
ncbi:MAG: GNAT family N-acetyltransferase, partial [Candidatus Micrarchaeia archaeon]